MCFGGGIEMRVMQFNTFVVSSCSLNRRLEFEEVESHGNKIVKQVFNQESNGFFMIILD